MRLTFAPALIVSLMLPSVSATADTTVILVRHAEKAKIEGNDDPPLLPIGDARAQALRAALASVKLDRIYTTQYLRNRSTVEPIAQATKLTPIVVDAKRSDELVKTLKGLGDVTVLVAGHSNTVPELLSMLGVKDGPKELGDEDYDNLFIVTWSKGRPPRLIHLHFGAPSK